MKPRLAAHVVVGDDDAAERAVQVPFERISAGVIGAWGEDVDDDIVADIIWVDEGRPIIEAQAGRGFVQPVIQNWNIAFFRSSMILRLRAIGSVRPTLCTREARSRSPLTASRSHWSVTGISVRS